MPRVTLFAAGVLCAAMLVSEAPLRGQDATFRQTTQTVAVFATVTGPDGRLVPDLPQTAFSIFDNGKPQRISIFANDIQPITVVMLLDRSGSMRANFRLVEEAAGAFVDAMLPGDKARIGSFSNRIQVDPRDFTSDPAELRRILHTELQPEGPTPLWNAVNVGITALLHQEGRRVILVFTDGMDSPGSIYSASLRDVMKRAEEENVMVYAIGLASTRFGRFGGGPGVPGGGFPRRRGGGIGGGFGGGFGGSQSDKPDQGLSRIAAATGGGYFELTSTADLAATFTRVADELHHQYALGFEPPKLDGKRHDLELRLADKTMSARARKSYVAPREGT
jgi:Ca-activated chloride channel family protein